jgi:Protein of unknown function (DUF4065)
MLLELNIQKAIAATAYLVQKQGGSDSMFFVLKKLYYADRTALINWGMSITGDELASMDKGPVVSGIYDLFKGSGLQKNLSAWNEAISKNGNTVRLKKEISLDVLSEREIELLEKSRTTIDAVQRKGLSVAHWIHAECPEWQDPHGSSIPIDPSVILRNAGRTDAEIHQIEESNEAVNFVKLLLGAR